MRMFFISFVLIITSLMGSVVGALEVKDQTLKPKKADYYIDQAIAHYDLDEFELALNDLNKAISLGSKGPDIYQLRGGIYIRLERYQEALVDLNKALELSPKDNTAYNAQGEIYRALKDYDEAEKSYKQAIRFKMYEAYYNLGLTYFLMGKPYHSVNAYLQGFLKDKNVFDVIKGLSIEDILSGRF